MSEPTIITRTRTNVYAKGMKIELCESTVEKKFVLMNDGSLSPAVEADNILAGCLANAKYGSPERYASIIAESCDNAAAIPNSCWLQSI